MNDDLTKWTVTQIRAKIDQLTEAACIERHNHKEKIEAINTEISQLAKELIKRERQ